MDTSLEPFVSSTIGLKGQHNKVEIITQINRKGKPLFLNDNYQVLPCNTAIVQDHKRGEREGESINQQSKFAGRVPHI